MSHELTVEELVDILNTYPDDARVFLLTDGGGNPWLTVDLNPNDFEAPQMDVFNNEPDDLGGPYRFDDYYPEDPR